MTVHEAIVSRRSIRRYTHTPVRDEDLKALMESARRAPSGSNTQPWNFIIVRADDTRNQIADVCEQTWMCQAPVFLVCVGDTRTRIRTQAPRILNEESPQFALKQVIRDTTIAIDHLVLQAESLGLSTCWVAYFTQDALRPILHIPSDKFVVAVITIGYADEHPPATSRKALEDMIHFEAWGQTGTSQSPSFFS
jgi:nitroreductase